MMHTTRHLRRLGVAALAVFTLAACDDDTTIPIMADVSADVSALQFETLDVDFGPGLAQTLTIRNDGDQSAMVGPASLRGSAAADFMIEGGSAPTTLAGGESMEIVVTFDPRALGSRSSTLEIPVQNGTALMLSLSGSGADYTFAQVDRVGIPTLNTVFNHPPQFSKTDYNTASTAADVEAYTGLFETVLGAVANPNPSATAALLLPDALPVSLGVSVNAFGSLTGRDLADDAVDVALTVTVGIESLHSDNVDSNDRAFLTAFPYLADPNG